MKLIQIRYDMRSCNSYFWAVKRIYLRLSNRYQMPILDFFMSTSFFTMPGTIIFYHAIQPIFNQNPATLKLLVFQKAFRDPRTKPK